MQRLGFIVFLFIFIVTTLPAAELRIGLPVDVNEVDPFDLALLEESEIFVSVNENLLHQQILTGFEPALAEQWEFDKAKKTITFHIRTNQKFSDGSELTAKDVEFTFKRLMLLDAEKNLTITKCLSSKNKTFNDINKSHPLIRVTGANTIVLGPTECGESILNEISDPSYGIISRKAAGKDLKMLIGAATSGPFVYKKNASGFKLVPNLYNWRWKNAKEKDLTLTFIKVDQNFSSIAKNKIDIFRTSNKTILEDATKNGFRSLISVPIMVWFITSEPDKLKETIPALNLLSSGVAKRKYKIFDKNILETSATSFFPNEFNCDGFAEKKGKLAPVLKNGIVRLINHRSKESEVYISDIKNELESHGLTVLVDDQKSTSSETPIPLLLKRQFLGDGVQGSLRYAFRTVRTIPDPQKKIIKKLDRLDQENVDAKERSALLDSTCRELQFFNHVPLSHRKYAFLYRSEKYKDMFSKGNGNLVYVKLIK